MSPRYKYNLQCRDIVIVCLGFVMYINRDYEIEEIVMIVKESSSQQPETIAPLINKLPTPLFPKT